MQLDKKERGFSFSKEGPLDMRMDRSKRLTAKEVVNRWTEKELGKIFREFGEEPKWRSAAKAIVERRKKKTIETTTELANIVAPTLTRHKRHRRHPATLIFQALRIAVNDELKSISIGVKKALAHLNPEGVVAALSFQSCEDRIVKGIFRDASQKQIDEAVPLLEIVTKKPLVPTLEEQKKNPRARSAKLRFAKRKRMV